MRNNNVSYDASLDKKMEERNQVDIIRDDSDKIKVGDIELGKIRKYKYKVYNNNNAVYKTVKIHCSFKGEVVFQKFVCFFVIFI